jgi:hypothetical protein
MKRTTVAKRVAMKDEKVVVIHDCTQVQAIKYLVDNTSKLNLILLGNGDPEKGLCRKVAIIAERQENIFLKLSDIHVSLDNYHKETQEAKETALTVKSAFDKYESEAIGRKKGKDELSTQGQVRLNNVITVISAIVMVATLIFSSLDNKEEGIKNKEQIVNKIDNFGTPVILNSRGQIDELPAGDSLKFFRDGEFNSTYKDTIK